ncbi:MAG: ATP-binding cassette domain-containing protein, partial [Alphaproteobacteria bacterium]|nr:ATP-binding cassette domain-containing protein [Alphaproteobacteria bacterium]
MPDAASTLVGEAAVECRGLTFGYGDADAPPLISGLDLRVATGKILCILGASGCGKTSLLNLIAGFLLPRA